MISCEKANENRDNTPEEESWENAWTYNHNKVGPLVSTIWGAFIDTREIDFWHIYLSPVKITLPVDFPLDGSKILFWQDQSIVVEYGREKWSWENSPKGYVKAAYDARDNYFEIRFSTASKLKGYYCGELTIIE